MQGKVAFVTGGANGIGRATAKAFLEQGVSVAIADIDQKRVESATKEFESIGPAIMPIVADLSDPNALEGLVRSAITKFGRLDFLVNSAAILGGTYNILEIKAAEWDRTLALNLRTPMLLMQAFARHVIERGGGGRIVNVTSSSAFRARQTKPAYGSAKGGLGTLTRIVAAQLGEHDINVNAVAPGITNTPGTTSSRNVSLEAIQLKASEGPQANFFKRVSEAEDVAATIVFLCSAGSRQITGQTIHVSAGAITI